MNTTEEKLREAAEVFAALKEYAALLDAVNQAIRLLDAAPPSAQVTLALAVLRAGGETGALGSAKASEPKSWAGS